jgi:hypothetical protein
MGFANVALLTWRVPSPGIWLKGDELRFERTFRVNNNRNEAALDPRPRATAVQCEAES